MERTVEKGPLFFLFHGPVTYVLPTLVPNSRVRFLSDLRLSSLTRGNGRVGRFGQDDYSDPFFVFYLKISIILLNPDPEFLSGIWTHLILTIS